MNMQPNNGRLRRARGAFFRRGSFTQRTGLFVILALLALVTVVGVGWQWQIKVESRNRAITLSGKVSSRAERALAERVARGVKGVRVVSNRLTVSL
jgi:hypothetical protein